MSEFFARALMIDVKRQITRQTDRATAGDHADTTDLTDLAAARLSSPSAWDDYDRSLRRCGDLAAWVSDQAGVTPDQARLLVATRVLGIPLTQIAGSDARRVGRQRARNEHKLRQAASLQMAAP